jgi:hypothetical protein
MDEARGEFSGDPSSPTSPRGGLSSLYVFDMLARRQPSLFDEGWRKVWQKMSTHGTM